MYTRNSKKKGKPRLALPSSPAKAVGGKILVNTVEHDPFPFLWDKGICFHRIRPGVYRKFNSD